MEYKENYKLKFKYDLKVRNLLKSRNLGEFEINYNSNIIYNTHTSEKIKIQVFYESGNFLFDKIDLLFQSKIDVLSGISIFNPLATSPKAKINFSKSKLFKLTDDNGYWENGLQYIILEIDYIRIEYEYKSGEENNANFNLNENALFPIDMQYELHGFNYNYPEKFEAINKEEFLRFGQILFRLELKFNITYFFKNEMKVRSTPLLKIKTIKSANVISETELLLYADLLCILLSLYFNREIFHFHAEIFEDKRVVKINKFITGPVDFDEPKTFIKEYGSFYEFIKDCDFEKIKEENSIISNITYKLIYSIKLEQTAEFMLLYNLLEKIRNHYLHPQNKSVKEKYTFKIEKKKIDKIINSKLFEIGELIIDTEKDNFINSIGNKVNFIKRMSMNNQFNSLYSSLNINLEKDYNLDIKKIIKIRNSIFHGSVISEDLIEINSNLRILIKELTMKIIKLNRQ